MSFNQNQQNFDPINVGETKHPDRKRFCRGRNRIMPYNLIFISCKLKKKTTKRFGPLKVFLIISKGQIQGWWNWM